MNIEHERRSRYGTGMLVTVLACTASLSLLFDSVSADDGEHVSDVCLDCHEGYAAGLDASPHRLSPGDAAARVACSDCHAGDARHYEDDPEEYPREDPSHLAPMATALVCSQCHMNSHQQNMMEGNVHAANDVSCTGCHQVHGNHSAGLLHSGQTTLCLDCHTDVAAQFAQAYRHPVNDDVVACADCHMTLDVTSVELARHGTNEPCMDCHVEFQGPFPFEHQATVDYSTEEGGCLSCHSPHGSNLPRMLQQPYESPHYQLCSQCHSVPGHNQNTRHGTRWAGMACNECHTDIHGSYVSRHFLTESLQGQGCFASGCHAF